MNTKLDNFETMLTGYVTCALWSSMDQSDDSGGLPLDELYSAADIDEATREQMRKEWVEDDRAIEALFDEVLALAWDDFCR